MCGFSGIVTFNNYYNPSVNNLKKSLQSIVSRGPDKSLIVKIGNHGLFGHNRLSIQDLTDFGSQPMISKDGRYTLIFNGEIYNYKEIKMNYFKNINFNSSGDTELLLKLWELKGKSMFKLLDGMFAFSIWDNREKELILARDRFGEKPLFYSIKDNIIFLSSRLKSLTLLDKNINKKLCQNSVNLYLQMGYIPHPFSIFENIYKVEPGSFIILKKNYKRKVSYFNNSVFYNSTPKQIKYEEAQEELEYLIKKSVKNRLISDVPVGSFLSSGIDSSLISAIATKHFNKNLKTFTIGFSGNRNDESNDAMLIARKLGTNHFSKNFAHKDLLNFFTDFFENYDEPFADNSAFPSLAVSKFAKKKVKVILSGEGADELFGGYHYYKIMKVIKNIKLFKKFRPEKIIKKLTPLSNHNIKLLLKALEFDDPFEIFAFIRSISKDTDIVLNKNNKTSIYSLFKTKRKYFKKLSFGEIGMKLDSIYTLSDDYLQKMDLASMTYSIENRAPFLSNEIIDFSSKLPEKYKFDIFENKKILRDILYKYIPRRLINKSKKGFGVPMDNWLRTDLRDWCYSILNNNDLYKDLPLDKKKVLYIFNQHCSGKRNYHPILWAVVVLLKFNESII